MRTWSNLTPEQQKQLADIYSDRRLAPHERELRFGEKVLELGLTTSLETLKRQIRQFNATYFSVMQLQANNVIIPQPNKRKYLDYEVVESDNFICLSDIEIPNHNEHMLKLAWMDAMVHGVTDAVWNGDLVATDQEALNSWVSTWQERGSTFEEDVNELHEIASAFAKLMKRMYATEGNHDDRVARATSGNVHLGMLLRNTPIAYSRYSYLYVATKRRGFVKVVHPQNFSANPITLGQELYDVERGPHYPQRYDKCHIVLGHCHRAQSGFSKDGRMEIHSTGMLRDDLRTQYKMKSSNKHKQWDAGYLICINGFLYNRTLRGTDWEAVLQGHYKDSPVYRFRKELGLSELTYYSTPS